VIFSRIKSAAMLRYAFDRRPRMVELKNLFFLRLAAIDELARSALELPDA